MRRRVAGGETAARAWWVPAALGVALLGLLALLPAPWTLGSGAGFASPSGRPLRDTVFAAIWWVAAGLVPVCALVAASAPLWARAAAAPPSAARAPIDRRVWAALFALALLAIGLRAPLAAGSLWWDEAWSIRRVVVGVATPDPRVPDRVVVARPPWSRPLWDYRKPTNHVLYNTAARASTDLWRALSGGAPESFSEVAFRLPSLAAAAAAVVALGVLLAWFGRPRAGLLAAALLAVHPWHIRHGAEGRSYSLVVLFALLASLALLAALRSGRWRDWLAFAGSQWLLLWAQPSAVYLALAFGAAALIGIATDGGSARDRTTRGMRLAVCGVAAFGALALVLAPNFAQALAWTDVFQDENRIDVRVLVDLWTTLASGIQAYTVSTADPAGGYASLEALEGSRPWLWPVVGLGLPLLAALGAVRLLAVREARIVLLAITAGVALALGFTWARNLYYYHRFVIYALVPVLAALAVGADALASALVQRLVGRARSVAWAALLGASWIGAAWIGWPQTQLLLTRPIQPLRDVTQWVRAQSPDAADGVLRAGLGLGGEMPRVYDPWWQSLQTPQQFARWEASARADERAAYVAFGYRAVNQPRFPDAFERLADPSRFEFVAEFRGVEPPFHYAVLRVRRDAGAARR